MTDLTEEQWRVISYLNFKMQCIADQEEVGIELDYDKAVRHRDELLIAQEEKVVELKKVMPKIPKTTKKTKPKITHKKDGTLSVAGSNWFSLLKSNGLSITFNGELEVITGYEEPNPNSTPQVKDWLFSLGWKPATYKYVRDKATGDERKIEQVRKDGELCPSVLRLAKVEPNIALLEGLSIIQHRLGMFQGFIDSSYTKEINGEIKACTDCSGNGYLSGPMSSMSFDYDCPKCKGTGRQKRYYVKSEIGGLTNTLRFKHKKPIANMPKVGVAWGEEIRGCLIATSPHVFCGSDLVSLESTTKRHYMYPYDPEYVNEMSKEGFDEHINLAKFAGKVTQEDEDRYIEGNGKDLKSIRDSFKPVNYAGIYGVREKTLSRQTGMSVSECKSLLDSYWDRNWAVKEIAKDQIIKTVGGEMWLYNPVSGFWISLRYEKDIFSSLNQSTGVYVFDKWLALVKKENVTIALQYHDEWLGLIEEGQEKETEIKVKSSIDKLNKLLKLNVPIGADSNYGKTYASVH